MLSTAPHSNKSAETTTKLTVVYDASEKTRNELNSLNDWGSHVARPLWHIDEIPYEQHRYRSRC